MWCIKASRSSTIFDYQITVSQISANSENSSSWIFFVVALVVTIVAVLAIGLLLGYLIRKWSKNKVGADNTEPLQLDKLRYIDKTLGNMKSGEYKDLRYKYSQTSCSICLDLFTHKWKVHVTNEWRHVFHSSCLDDWFWNIKWDLALRCPNWNTILTPQSSPVLDSDHSHDSEEKESNEMQLTHRNIFERTIVRTY